MCDGQSTGGVAAIQIGNFIILLLFLFIETNMTEV